MPMNRIRFFYQKKGNIKFTGALDMQKIWERSCRRANLPIAYSQGFHPQARIQQAAPLPLGIEGLSEIVDIWFNLVDVPDNLETNINQALPPGLSVKEIQLVDVREPSMQNRIYSSIYSIRNIDIDECLLKGEINKLLSSTDFYCERRGKRFNLRERINSIEIISKDDGIFLRMDLKQLPGMTGRPEDVVNNLGIEANKTRIVRERLNYL